MDTGNVTFNADIIIFTYTNSVQTTGSVTFHLITASTSIAVDGTGSTLNITSGILSAITAGSLNFGSTSDTGVMTVDANRWSVPTTFTTGISGSIAIAGNQTGTGSATLTFNGPVTLSGSYTVATNKQAISFGSTIDDGNSPGTDSLPVNAGSTGSATFTGEVGSNTPIGTLSVTAGGGITLNAVTATSVDLDSSSGSGNIASNNSGLITATSGTITVNSGGDIDFSNIGQTTTNQSVSDTAAGNAYLNAIDTGTGSLTVNATNVFSMAGIARPNGAGRLLQFQRRKRHHSNRRFRHRERGHDNRATYSSTVPAALGSATVCASMGRVATF